MVDRSRQQGLHPRESPLRDGQRGFTYLGVLVAVAILGLGLAAAAEVWVTTARRQKVEELQWIGRQFVAAIGSYYTATPGLGKAFPARLEDLLEDRRYVTTRRHLRTIYRNPFTGQADWEPIKSPAGGIAGVRVTAPSGVARATWEFVYAPASTQ